MRRIAIITARGGSKRIPRKNVKLFLGKPILVYSIEAALDSGIFEEVMVSTDDEEIASIARQAGAKVPFMRSETTSNDYATTAEVMLEVIESYKEIGQTFDQVCCIYPTAPFVTGERLREAVHMLSEKQCETVMPVVPFSFPPQRCVVIREGEMKAKFPEDMMKRSQDLEPYYHDAGQFYCVDCKAFCNQQKLIMDHTVPIVLREMEVQDIDTLEDWELAQVKYGILNS